MWTIKDCFAGPDCWCGIIVSPNGDECNQYGTISRENCQYIINAMNKTPNTEHNINDEFPIPWYMQQFNNAKAIVTQKGLVDDSLEYCISPCDSIFYNLEEVFVNEVNKHYLLL